MVWYTQIDYTHSHKTHSNKYLSCVLSSVNRGLLLGSYDQHFVIKLYRVGGHWGGMARRSPFSILPITSLFFTPWKGLIPNISISHIQTPIERKTEKQKHSYHLQQVEYIRKKQKQKSRNRNTTVLNLPNIQTSLAVVNRLKLMDSGAIHLIGSLPLDAITQKWELCSISSSLFDD